MGKVHSNVACVDLQTLLRNPAVHEGRQPNQYLIPEDEMVEVLRDSLRLRVSPCETVDFLFVRHLDDQGASHEGWIPGSFVILQ